MKNNNQDKEKRKADRYSVSGLRKDSIFSDILLEIKNDINKTAELIDISMNGVGIHVKEAGESELLRRIMDLDNYFISIDHDDIHILAEVRKIWALIPEETPGILKTGAAFSIISAEDRLRLSELIMEIRDAD